MDFITVKVCLTTLTEFLTVSNIYITTTPMGGHERTHVIRIQKDQTWLYEIRNASSSSKGSCNRFVAEKTWTSIHTLEHTYTSVDLHVYIPLAPFPPPSHTQRSQEAHFIYMPLLHTHETKILLSLLLWKERKQYHIACQSNIIHTHFNYSSA